MNGLSIRPERPGCAALLETGALPEFAATRAFYRRHGFVERGPFGDYADDPNSAFMSRSIG